MRTIISFIPFFIFFACGSSGIEGYVDEPITITAENPEEGKDVDYFWTLVDLPDGSLMNSGDLISSNDGQQMVFTPDYPGDYSVEVVISQYGDEISKQTFAFLIMDFSERDTVGDEESVEPENEDWLNEEMDDEIDEEENEYADDEDADEDTLKLVAENYAHEFMMLGYTSKKVLSLFTSPHFKSANTVYNILGPELINEVIANVFGQKIEEVSSTKEEGNQKTKR